MTWISASVAVGIGLFAWCLCAAAKRGDVMAEQCSREWVRDQTRRRGLSGWSGSYQD